MDRRTFLGTVGAALVAARHLRAASLGRIGAQLYTVRGEMEKDFDGTIAKVAAIGYEEVEFAGYFNHTPAQVREALQKNGLTAPSAHVDYATMSNGWAGVVETAHAIGHEYLVIPWIDEALRTPEFWPKFADELNHAGEATKAAGIQLAYHNHNFEFAPTANGRRPYDILLERCDPALVKMEPDLCWMTVGGADPVDYFHRYPGRFPLVHVKGMSKHEPVGSTPLPIDQALPDITEVGHNDIIDWARIFADASEAGIRHYFVEQDVSKSPFDSLAMSYRYLRGLQF
jgi:sugar phosphate isomerase/epimerase